jgi:hypothetical protein
MICRNNSHEILTREPALLQDLLPVETPGIILAILNQSR